MDAPWKHLPHDLVKKVLARLPLASVARARAVCKRWYTVVQTCHFLRMRREFQLSPEAYLFLYWERESGEVSVYNAAEKKWQPFSRLSFVPFMMCVPPIAGAGGLFCFACTESLVVCNFLTRKWRQIPPLQGFRPALNPWTFAHLVLDPDRLGYKIILGRYEYSHLGHRPSNLRIKLFDSRSSSWKAEPSPPPPLEVSLRGSVGINSQSLSGHGTTSQVLGSILYCLDNEWRHVMAYDIDLSVWIGEPIRLPRSFRSTWFPPCLLEHRGNLCLVGAQDVFGDASSRRIIVHTLDLETTSWCETFHIPHERYKELDGAPYIYKCFLHDDFICFITKDAGILYSLRDGSFATLPMKFTYNWSLLYLSESTLDPTWNVIP